MNEGTSQILFQEPFASEVAAASLHLVRSCEPTAGLSMPVHSWRYRYIKRLIDFTAAVILVTLLAVPGLLIAAAIVLTSRGPVFYREERVGRGGSRFRIWKFRSMFSNASLHRWVNESAPDGRRIEWRMCKEVHDPRITPVGRFLRRWSFDEIPQLFNVLSGDMSLIGPRPIVESEIPHYGERVSVYLAANPGLSGLWQISGRSRIGYLQRAELDEIYVQSWSLGADLRIFLLTVPAVVGRVGAN